MFHYIEDSHRSKVCERIRTSEKNSRENENGDSTQDFFKCQVYVASSSAGVVNNVWNNIPIYFVICLFGVQESWFVIYYKSCLAN